MKTTLERIKLLGESDSTLATYVARHEIVAPRTLPVVSVNELYFIGYAPMSSQEQWVAQRKQQMNIVEAYLVSLYTVQEYSLIGTTTRKGVFDFVSDFKDAVRGSFLPPTTDANDYYLSKPLEAAAVDFSTEPYGDGYYLIIATVTLECPRLFNA